MYVPPLICTACDPVIEPENRLVRPVSPNRTSVPVPVVPVATVPAPFRLWMTCPIELLKSIVARASTVTEPVSASNWNRLSPLSSSLPPATTTAEVECA